MKLYLAGPMRGYKDFNFPAFHAAAKDLREKGHEVFSPAEKDIEDFGDTFISETGQDSDLGNGFDLREALKMDLSWICQEGEGIALLKGWEKSPGATAEYSTAVALGQTILVQNDFGWKVKTLRSRKRPNAPTSNI